MLWLIHTRATGGWKQKVQEGLRNMWGQLFAIYTMIQMSVHNLHLRFFGLNLKQCNSELTEISFCCRCLIKMTTIKVISNKIIIIYTYITFSPQWINKDTVWDLSQNAYLSLTKLLSALLQVSLLAKTETQQNKKKRSQEVPMGDLGDKMSAYSYLEQMNTNRQRARSSAQNRTGLRKM